jgi:hypothetical protein
LTSPVSVRNSLSSAMVRLGFNKVPMPTYHY